MHIAINALFLIPGEVGGSETYLREILLAVAREHPHIRLSLITNIENDASLHSLLAGYPQCSFHLLPVRATNRYARIIAEQTRLPWMLRRIKPDVLWSPGYTMPFRAPCRQVVSILDMQYRSHPDDLTRIARWTTHALVMMAACRADRIITISEFSKREIIKHTGCPAERIAVTHLGVDPGFGEALINIQRSTSNAQLSSEALNTHVLEPATSQPSTINHSPFLLSVANSYPHKNLDRLVDAFALIADQIPHQLVLVGRPRLGEPALLRALEKVPPGRVRRIAGLSREELISLYQSADLFVFPSLYEGFGLPVLEAMMAGVPVVTTREGSIPEVGGDEVTYSDGRDPADLAAKILEAIHQSPESRQIRAQSARTRAAAFTWSVAAEKTAAAWQAAVG